MIYKMLLWKIDGVHDEVFLYLLTSPKGTQTDNTLTTGKTPVSIANRRSLQIFAIFSLSFPANVHNLGCMICHC